MEKSAIKMTTWTQEGLIAGAEARALTEPASPEMNSVLAGLNKTVEGFGKWISLKAERENTATKSLDIQRSGPVAQAFEF